MPQSYFQNPEELEADRISEEEAAQVVKLWAEKERQAPPAHTTASISDLAEGLEISPERARSLLQEVRESRGSLREIPAPYSPAPSGNYFMTIALLAFGVAMISLIMGSPWILLIASTGLAGSLFALRKWSLALVSLFLIVGIALFYARGTVQQTPPAMAPPPIMEPRLPAPAQPPPPPVAPGP